jgi:hypothetical protein
VHPVVHWQQPQRSKELLAQKNFLAYLLYDAYSNHVAMSQHQKALESQMDMELTEPLESTWLLIQGTGIETKEYL